VRYPHVARFALPAGECSQSEAAVERAFRAQSFIFDELRARDAEELIEAEMMICMSWKKVFHPADHARDAKEAAEEREKKRKQAEEGYEKLLAERTRK